MLEDLKNIFFHEAIPLEDALIIFFIFLWLFALFGELIWLFLET